MRAASRGRPPGDGVVLVVPFDQVLGAYAELRADHRRNGWRAPTQLQLAVALGWSEKTLQRYLRAHGVRWPSVRGGDVEFLTGSCPAARSSSLAPSA